MDQAPGLGRFLVSHSVPSAREEVKGLPSLMMNGPLTKATMYAISQLLQGLDRIKRGMCNRADRKRMINSGHQSFISSL